MISEAADADMKAGGGLTVGGDMRLTRENCESVETTLGLRERDDTAPVSKKSGALKVCMVEAEPKGLSRVLEGSGSLVSRTDDGEDTG